MRYVEQPRQRRDYLRLLAARMHVDVSSALKAIDDAINEAKRRLSIV